MKTRHHITVTRAPELGGYVIVDDIGIRRIVPGWRPAVQVLCSIAMENSSEIAATKPKIDAGETVEFRSR